MSATAKRWWDKARRWRRRLAMPRTAPRVAVLMYHRVTEPVNDPWKMCVSPRCFGEHMAVLGRHCEVISLASLPAALSRSRTRPVVAITFDDGYRDNLENALPILRAAGLPATLFLATDGVGSAEPWWWDVLADLVMEPRLPPSLDMTVGGARVVWRLAEGPDALRNRLWETLSRLNVLETAAKIRQLCEWAGHQSRRDLLRLPLSAEQVGVLVKDGLVTLGCHSASHLRMPVQDPATCAQELLRSKEACQHLSGAPTTLFAFPYGEYDPPSIEVVRAAGFSLACTSNEGLIEQSSDPLALPRLGVGNWSGSYFDAWLRSYWCA